jgi:hypothetical protein
VEWLLNNDSRQTSNPGKTARVCTAHRGKSPGLSSFYVAHRTAIDFPRGRITQIVEVGSGKWEFRVAQPYRAGAQPWGGESPFPGRQSVIGAGNDKLFHPRAIQRL